MNISDSASDEFLKDRKSPEDLLDRNGILKQHQAPHGKAPAGK